jgi:hypothetical protein
LVSPVYFGNGAACSKLFVQQIDIGTEMKASFEINVTQGLFEGALLYKLQRCSNNQYNMDTSTIENNKETCIQMFVSWKAKDTRLFVRVVLIKHTKEFIWNEDKLKKLYNKNRGWLRKYDDTVTDTWLMNDNMVLRTSFKVRGFKENFELNIFISEEERIDDVIRPLCVDLKR